MDREYGNKKKVHMKENIRETENPPLGLSVLEPNEELDMLFMLALNETENVLSNECSNQIASNQHFFINFPFPLNHGRESGTPLFSLDSTRVVSLVALVMKTFQAFQLSSQEINDLLPRSNIIVREYRVGQQISFHVDELECDSQVFGFILLNESPKQNGLMFRKGEDKVTMNYTLKETTGTMFHLTDEARYKWKHGLKSVEARRISVTIRIFKNSYLNNKNIANVESLIENDNENKIEEMPKWMIEDSTSDEEEAEKATNNKPSGNNNKIRIQVCKNNNRTITKPALLDSPVKLSQLKQIVKNKLGVTGKKYYFANGEEVIEGVEIIDDIVIYVSQGEGFTGAKQSKGQENKMNAKLKALKKDYFLGQRLIHEKIIWWNNYKFGKLKFKAIKCTDPDARPHDDDTVTLDSMVELGLNLQKSHLTIPEFRDLIHTLRAIVDERSNHLWWTFRTSVWEDGRSSSVGIKYWNKENEGPSPYEGMWVEFEARGDKAYKGAKKRDGDLWALEGGLNNPFDKEEKEKAEKEKKEKESQKKEEIEQDSGSDDDDENSEDDQLSVKSGKKNKQIDPNVISNTPRINDKKNKYQKKRGVIFTPGYVFFAGTVWCSSYYTCKILSENVTYTSATQLVMADQARLFGDEKRLSQILSSSFDPAPHKAFDHKAPKTGQRKVLHFNNEVWEKHKLRLMWKATYEKFNQNMALKNRMLQTVGERSFVEATDDFVWGIGLALDHPDVANPAKWRAPNAMGVILTVVYKLILMEFESPSFSLERITYLEANSKSIPSDNFHERLLTFISTIEESGDTERFKAPSWTSIKSVHEVKEWISKSQPLSLDHLFGVMTSYLKLTEEQRNSNSDNTLLGNVEWYQSLLYLIEGALGFRKF